MKTRIIVNPMANKGSCGKRWPQIRTELEKHLGPIDDNDIAMTRARNHATKLAPNDGIAFSTLGLVEYRAARFAAALAALLRSQELLGEERLGTRGFLLAMTYWQMSSDNQDVDNRASQREQAQNWFRRAVEWTDRFDSGNIELRRLQAEAAKLLNPLPASDSPAKP